ncbi:stress response small protein YobI [Escherichia coli]|nr:stress response small protein YobI [Escherichia coli]EHK8932616.1 stress response small protein YobI [Escherichia coli]EII1916311.1 stress response small protein YobI [Escherichia coli]MCX9366473.1 stress response small protein YobI [Escherichia coli]MCX9370679.1 stress response small protein YobI [Escherichia coli]MCX9388531.1 stress response small protein YobI [Escherichia coli]
MYIFITHFFTEYVIL